MLVLRLAPLVPFAAVNYGSGLTVVRFRAYLAATGLGILPWTLAYVALGAYGTDPGSPPFIAAAAGLALLALGGAVVAGRGRARVLDAASRHRRPADDVRP